MRKMIVVLGLTLALVSLFGLTAAVNATPSEVPDAKADKIRICHAKPADTAANGYNSIKIAKDGTVLTSQHNTEHDADIIPAFDWAGKGNDPGGHFDGKNWDSEGQAIWDNGCKVPRSPTATSQPPTATVEPTEGPSPTATSPRPTTTPCDFGCEQTSTPTPKPHHHQETGPEDTPAVFGWMVTMGIGLASAGIAGMRRR